MKIRYFILCFLAVSITSCKKIFINPDKESEPERNFEIFWNDINNGYPYFEEDGINWQDRYEKYRPLVKPSTPIPQLYQYMTQMLSGFSDGHLSVSYQGEYFSNEKTIYNIIDLVREDASGTRVRDVDAILYYINNFKTISKGYLDPESYNIVTASNGLADPTIDTVCVYGYNPADEILYVHLITFLTQYGFDDLLNNIFAQYPTAKGLVLDLRMNGGGNLLTMWKAMSVFVPRGVSEVKYGYVREKVGPLPENFGREDYFAIPGNYFKNEFLKPIVLLTNKASISSAEHATMAMREIKKYNPKIKIVGDYTFGATSFIVERTLPCGIKYTLVNSKTTDINRNVIERTGVKPDEVIFNTASSVLENKDDQLERAFEILRSDSF